MKYIFKMSRNTCTINYNDGSITRMLFRDVQCTDIKISVRKIEPNPQSWLGSRKWNKYLKCPGILVQFLIMMDLSPECHFGTFSAAIYSAPIYKFPQPKFPQRFAILNSFSYYIYLLTICSYLIYYSSDNFCREPSSGKRKSAPSQCELGELVASLWRARTWTLNICHMPSSQVDPWMMGLYDIMLWHAWWTKSLNALLVSSANIYVKSARPVYQWLYNIS
jgi:hypothetical protein